MELASNGYVVISMDHPYHSFFTKDTDGKLITVDPEFLNEVMYVNENNVPEKDIHELSHKWLAIRTADMNYVLDSLETAKQTGTDSDTWFFCNDGKVDWDASGNDVLVRYLSDDSSSRSPDDTSFCAFGLFGSDHHL